MSKPKARTVWKIKARLEDKNEIGSIAIFVSFSEYPDVAKACEYAKTRIPKGWTILEVTKVNLHRDGQVEY